ncbi:class II histone deacetylase [Streptomyces sp. NPDC059193]|uniref:class II histone deacetylase n=1 Tax=Streptomyces sp. NPDC059193 TaxID=3346763 RepID=UPI0036A21945
MTTAYVWHERYGWYDTGNFHPPGAAGAPLPPHPHYDAPEPRTRLHSLVEASGLARHLLRITPSEAAREDLLRVHTEAYVDRIARAAAAGGGDAGDGWTPFGPGAYDIAALAAGGAIAATEAVLTGRARNSYALVRPAGHHALRDTGMGWCLFANIAVAVERGRARHGVERVAVVDYDVHHGNGTQDIFARDPDVLTVSVHQEGLFPFDSGHRHERGAGAAVGTVVNVPLPAGSGNGAYAEAFRRIVVPAVRAFSPDLVIVASGFDASAADPLGRMGVSAAGYRDLAGQLLELAEDVCAGRLVMCHEGGYSPVYVPYCGLAVLESMSGHPTDVVDPYAAFYDARPYQELTPWQEAAVDQAAALVGVR